MPKNRALASTISFEIPAPFYETRENHYLPTLTAPFREYDNRLCIQRIDRKNGVGKLNDISPKALREIARLGCTHVWYTGVIEHATQTDYSRYGIASDNPHVVKGKAGSPYAIKDYYDIDPDLAVNVPDRMQEFEALIERTHQNKLKAIIDFVPNHVARQYRSDAKPDGITDLGSRDNTAHAFDTHNNFYYIPGQEFSPHFDIGEGATRYNEFPAKATGNDCFSPSPGQNDWYETVKLNYGVDYLNCMKKISTRYLTLGKNERYSTLWAGKTSMDSDATWPRWCRWNSGVGPYLKSNNNTHT